MKRLILGFGGIAGGMWSCGRSSDIGGGLDMSLDGFSGDFEFGRGFRDMGGGCFGRFFRMG